MNKSEINQNILFNRSGNSKACSKYIITVINNILDVQLFMLPLASPKARGKGERNFPSKFS